MGTGKTYKLKRSVREHFYLWKYVLLNHFLRGRNFFFMPWRRVKTNSNHLSVDYTFSVYRTELVLFKCKSQSLKGTDDSKLIFFSLYLHNQLYIGGSKVSSSQPRHKVQNKKDLVFFFFFSFKYHSQVRSIQVSFTKGGLIAQDDIDSGNIFDVHEFSQFHTSDYFIFI